MNNAKEQYEKYKENQLVIANDLWVDLKKKIKDDAKFVELSDQDKMKVYDSDDKYKSFCKDFPIVTKYMICVGQFSKKAFVKFLDKTYNMASTYNKHRGEKGYMEDQWIRRQADYLRYLWEAYTKGHYNNKEAQQIWSHAYESIKYEFKSFRDMHEKLSKEYEKKEVKNKSNFIKDLSKKLDKLDNNEEHINKLIEKAKHQKLINNKKKLNAEIIAYNSK